MVPLWSMYLDMIEMPYQNLMNEWMNAWREYWWPWHCSWLSPCLQHVDRMMNVSMWTCARMPEPGLNRTYPANVCEQYCILHDIQHHPLLTQWPCKNRSSSPDDGSIIEGAWTCTGEVMYENCATTNRNQYVSCPCPVGALNFCKRNLG